MSYHIEHKDYKCPHCSVFLIPYKKDFRCPNCNNKIDEYFDFVGEMIISLKRHKQDYGTYFPAAWGTYCLADHIQFIIFILFDGIAKQGSNELKDYTVDGEAYLQKHIKDIVADVYSAYKDEILKDYGIVNQE